MAPTSTPAQPAESDELVPTADLDHDLARLRNLVEEDRVEEARVLAPRLLNRWPNSLVVQKWASVLEPPTARVLHGKPTQNFDQAQEWLRAHGHQYPGCWLAVCGDQLLAASPDLSSIYRQVHEARGNEVPLISFQPGKPE